MQVKVFESTDMASGLKKVKDELGPDALILSTRTIKNGKLGLLGRPILEITAAIDRSAPLKNGSDKSRPVISPAFTLDPSAGFNHIVDDSLDHLLHQSGPASESTSDHSSCFDSISAGTSSDLTIRNEVNELKNLVKGLAGDISLLHKDNAAVVSGHPPITQKRKKGHASAHDDHILSMLLDRGINVETSKTISDFLRENLSDEERDNPNLVSSTIIEIIQNLLEISPPLFASKKGQHRIALVGPTGVGKTTTLAKIAASCLTSYSSSIALITVDTYRIAAVEQLKVYGEIMHIPVDVVISPDQLKHAIDSHRDKDLILIDTAGRSPKDDFCIEELSTFLSPELNIDKHLVLSATSREKELLNTIDRFNSLGLTNTIFTKVDECVDLGIILNIQIQNKNPLSYITNGQRVPEDLIELSKRTAAELIMSEH